jgi:hypothetical protein
MLHSDDYSIAPCRIEVTSLPTLLPALPALAYSGFQISVWQPRNHNGLPGSIWPSPDPVPEGEGGRPTWSIVAAVR